MRFSTLLVRSIGATLVAGSIFWNSGGVALAGTTGGISGVVTDVLSKTPIADAKVTVSSPSQTVTATTDGGGHFTFASLAPDEYTISFEKAGYDTASISGVAVFADSVQALSFTMRRALKEIGNVTSRSSADLVRPGTTADVYSIDSRQQARASVLGGGGNLNSAYSAIASVPGAYVPANQSGYNQAVHVRGGDSSEVGYEFDGIPVNRGFDNYPSSSASSLGQLELQVYTGATPANGEAQGLAGFINQVIKTGTHPGYGHADLSLGLPTFYHGLNMEAGGATPNRMFSYYVGFGGFNQDHRYIDQNNGQSLSNEFGPILDTCAAPGTPGFTLPPSCFTNGKPNVGQSGAPGYILGPMPFGNDVAGVSDRTTIANMHIGIPHKHDGGRDDIQLLYDNDAIFTPLYVSALDEGLGNFQGTLFYPAGTTPYYQDWYQYAGTMGTFLPGNASSAVQPYLFPSSPSNRPLFANIPLSARDIQYNQQAIVKLQYQRNFSSDSYLRLYGYTYYSTYNAAGAVSSFQPVTGFDSGDYELNSHTRGFSASFAKQFSSKHLVELQGSYTTAYSLRDNNSQMFGTADAFGVLVNPNDLTSGTCYAAPAGGIGAATPTTCNIGNKLAIGQGATFASLGGSFNSPTVNDSSGNPITPGSYTCGSGPCALYAVENGAAGAYNQVTPVFTGYSITDQFRPNDKLLFNLGLRLDNYTYKGADTTGTAARTFWFNAFNNDTCFNTQTLKLWDKTALGLPVSSACSAAGQQYQAAHLTNASAQVFTYNIFQPRIGVTYTLDPDTVLRASYGRYNEQPSAAYEQYNSLQQNLPNTLLQYYSIGFNTPGHQVSPAISYNSDFSLEHHFKGTDLSIKVTPFLRQTNNQIENFFTDIKQGFISGLNAGNQTSDGVELALMKGNFERNGIAAQLSFAYTNAYVKYSTLPNGTTILSPINADIQSYNGFTKFCSANKTDPRCGANSANAAPCYAAGAADPTCTAAGTIANPYWNAPVQGLLDPNGKYLPYSTVPGGIGTGANAYNYPYVATLILNYKHDRLALTPSFQFVAGNRYGAPEAMPGIDPTTCGTGLGTTIAGDPRYPYGAPGGAPFDATNCSTGTLLGAIPDSYTGKFDGIGEFRQPSQFVMHMRATYDVSSKVSLSLTLANLISTCFGGQQTPFTYYNSTKVCSWTGLTNSVSPVGNLYNPGDNIQTFQRYPYEPSFGTYNDLTSSTQAPFSAYFTMNVKF